VLATDNAGRIVAAVGIHAAAMPTMFLCTLLYTAALNSSWWGSADSIMPRSLL
jgi:hypothetical protein